MVIKEIEINKIHEYENNPRHNDAAVEKVAASIREFGFKVTLVIDNENVIVAGHTRIKAARLLGLSTVPCIVADDLTPDQIKAFRIADNKTGEYADWDIEKLTANLLELQERGFDMEQFGFDVDDEPGEIIEDEPPEPDEENEPIAAPGDVWQLGRHRLMCGDSTNANDVYKLMNGANINEDKPLRNGEHPTMKPVKLFAYLMRNSSRKNEIVLDVFGGSGTTLIAAEQLNRVCYAMELDPKYCDVIIERWEELTGEKAVKIND